MAGIWACDVTMSLFPQGAKIVITRKDYVHIEGAKHSSEISYSVNRRNSDQNERSKTDSEQLNVKHDIGETVKNDPLTD